MLVARIGKSKYKSDIVFHNRVAYMSGIIAKTHIDSVPKEQVIEIFSIIDKNLECIGSSKKDIISMMISFTDISPNSGEILIFNSWILEGNAPTYSLHQSLSPSISVVCAL